MSIAAVLLAAGSSERMGQPKALLDWQGRPLIRYQVDQLLRLPLVKLIVVLGHDADKLAPLVPKDDPRVWVGVNPDYRRGKSTSVRFGVRQVPAEAEAVLVIGVDQPRPAALLKRIVDEHLAHAALSTGSGRTLLTIPTYQGRRGHPVVYDRSLLPELLAVSEERQGLREITERHRHEIREVAVDSPLVLVNINTRLDYEAALKLAGATSS